MTFRVFFTPRSFSTPSFRVLLTLASPLVQDPRGPTQVAHAHAFIWQWCHDASCLKVGNMGRREKKGWEIWVKREKKRGQRMHIYGNLYNTTRIKEYLFFFLFEEKEEYLHLMQMVHLAPYKRKGRWLILASLTDFGLWFFFDYFGLRGFSFLLHIFFV